ncbi:MAG: MBL fold metallo-hydrolase [Chloroflexi bacterium]|nr:MBL fold metallo-hydrolase [Chloroflexota bacterium]
MKVKWLGHSSFLITSEAGIRIVTDPFEPAYVAVGGPAYRAFNDTADIVTVTHDHQDHSYVATVRGTPKVVKGTAAVKGIEFKGVPTSHDEAGGKQRGGNTVLCFKVDDVTVCHLGDLGHRLTEKQVAEIGKVDILLVPVGGYYTIDAATATQVCEQLSPRVVIPMHYKTEKCGFPITGVDEFLKGKTGVSRRDASEVEFKPGQLPATTQIIVLKPAL